MLPSERRRKEAVAAREAAGESLWTDDFDEAALVRLRDVWSWVERQHEGHNGESMGERVARVLRINVGHDIAVANSSMLTSVKDTELVLDLLAAVVEVTTKEVPAVANVMVGFMNRVMNEHRIAHKFVDGELLPLASDELHTEVVEPALRLLVGTQFAAAHGAYMAALKEISRGEAADAITDAGTALQETLTALGCKGNALGPLIKDANKRGLFAAHDQNMIDGINKFLVWASADRSSTGDAHKHSDASLADAWLMVHIVGALIVRLADPTKRTTD